MGVIVINVSDAGVTSLAPRVAFPPIEEWLRRHTLLGHAAEYFNPDTALCRECKVICTLDHGVLVEHSFPAMGS